LSGLDTVQKRGIINPEKHATEVAALKASSGRWVRAPSNPRPMLRAEPASLPSREGLLSKIMF